MRLEEVSFRYRRRGDWVLQEVDAGIEAGEIVVVRGRNGAGKSTLLQLIAGVLRPTRGTDRRPSWSRSAGYPSGSPPSSRSPSSAYLDAMAAFAGAGSTGGAGWSGSVWYRSGPPGWASCPRAPRRRSGLAQALISEPDLLILDEPWEGLDAAARDLVPGIVDELVAERRLRAGQRPPRGDRPAARRDRLDDRRRPGHRGPSGRADAVADRGVRPARRPGARSPRLRGRPATRFCGYGHDRRWRVTALVLMRLAGFIRTGRFIPPLIAALVLLGILYGGGQAHIAEAYGVSALMMFPILAWQTKLLLDTEPDVQRRLALVALRSRWREAFGGMFAAALVRGPGRADRHGPALDRRRAQDRARGQRAAARPLGARDRRSRRPWRWAR